VYLPIEVGWRKRWGKLAVRISQLNTRVPGVLASVSNPLYCRSDHPTEGGSLPLLVPPHRPFDGRL
jgi:hypothetical protein